MSVGVIWALVAALLAGLATVLEALGTRRAARGRDAAASGAGAAALVGAVRQWPFLAGVVLDVLSFVAELVALERLPLYVVEAMLSSALAVTAVGAAALLQVRLRRIEWTAVLAVCAGLAVLAVTAGREGSGKGDLTLRVVTLVATVGLLGAAWAASRLPAGSRATVLGLVAGLEFGLVGVAVRVLPSLDVGSLFTEPSAYAVAIGGIGGFVALTAAVEKGSVTAATAAMVITETVGPAAVGVLVLGDRTRTGAVPAAVAGFVVAVAGVLMLARFGDAERVSAGPASDVGHQEPDVG
ncbi:hypothetical protein AB0D08_03850 [Kitasatospora sp. NPDC048540]|uniref:hypothetical protein n=1 Tax=unclassified Kitasatospora TaxID=2633591 RepID=UPI00053B6249|nr:hypothetical protein [Kitasatospora sp. MBT63]